MFTVETSTGEILREGQACPKCSEGTLVVRTIGRSEKAEKIGQQFLGCDKFPACRKAGQQRKEGQPLRKSRAADAPRTPNVATHTAAPVLDITPRPATMDDAAQRAVAALQALIDSPRPAVLDEDAVRRIAQECIDTSEPKGTRTVLELRSIEGVKVSVDDHYLMGRLVALVSAGFHVFMWGPPGTGKTTAAMQAAKLLDRTSEIDTLDPTTFRSMVQGYMSPVGEPIHTAFTRCWTEGKVYIADECDLAPGAVQTLFNSALANGHAPLAWGNVERPNSFGFIATGNTAGRPTAAFPDRKPMSNAFADRLYFMYWPLDPAIECRAVGLPYSHPAPRKAPKIEPARWVQWVQSVREWSAVSAPLLQVTPRASLLGTRALAIGEHVEDVADALVFRGCDAAIRSKALIACPLPREVR